MLSNAYFLAKFRFDTAENEPAQNLQNFAKFANFADPNPLTLTLARWRTRTTAAAGAGWSSGGASVPAVVAAVYEGTRPDAPGPGKGSHQRRDLGQFRQNVARFRLYWHRFLQENTLFAAFSKIYQIIKLNFLKFGKLLQILRL